ncbi:hypothetical protein Q8F55_003103 [Vanrija albida]|uniref:Uncharacterized protein n=1 Tax=Vanrija albida TaxID=181172 RepID=A0ABR3QBK9_9TREE
MARPYRPNVLFDLELGDTSTMFTYFPDNWRPNPQPGDSWWQSTFEDNPDDYVPGMVGQGRAAHYYVADGMRVPDASLSFVGRGYTVRGKQNGSWTSVSPGFDVSDPTARTPVQHLINYEVAPVSQSSDDTLFRTTNMTFAFNSIIFRVREGMLALTSTTVMTGMVAEASTFDQVPLRVEPVVSNGNINPMFEKTGEWKVENHIGGVGGQDQIAYDHAVSGSADAVLKTKLPPGTSFLVLNGTTGPDYDKLYLNLQPPPPLTPKSYTYLMTKDKWVSKSLLYFTPLDPTFNYTLTLAPGDNSSVSLHSLTLYSGVGVGSNSPQAFGGLGTTDQLGVQHTPLKKPVNKGAIIGGVVGGVLGAILLAILGFWAVRKYRRRHIAPLRFERADEMQATPFIAAPASHGTTTAFESAAQEKAALRQPYQSVQQQEQDGYLDIVGSSSGPSSSGGPSRDLETASTSSGPRSRLPPGASER